MAAVHSGNAMADIPGLASADAGRAASDRELLRRYLKHGDASAFEILVRRHERGVWGVCRRVLSRYQDAEDAFQAVFLLLARKAASIRKREALGSWLYGVAYRTALRLKHAERRRWLFYSWYPFGSSAKAARTEPSQEAAFQELQQILDEEVQHLPTRFRAPFVLCCLEGMSRSDAARELGVKEGTLSGRLARGRQLLQKRLARRGVSLSASLIALALVHNSAPATLVHGTMQMVLAGKTITGSPPAIALADAAWKTMTWAKAAVAAAFCVVFTCVAAAGIVQVSAEPPAAKGRVPPVTSPGQSDVWSIAVSADGKFVASGAGWWDQPGEIGVWDLATRTPLKHFAEDRGVASVAFSPDGKRLASGSWSGHVRLRDWAAGKQTADLEVEGVARVVFSPDGSLLATVTERETAQLWEPGSGQLVAQLEGDPSRSRPASYACVAFTPDGQRVLAGGNDWQPNGRNEVIVWDVASKKIVRKLAGHRQAILCLACSPNGTIVASGGVDNTIRLWDVDSGKPLKTLRGHQDWVESVTFTDGGKTVVSGSHDGTVRFWDVAQGKERARINIRQGPWRPREGTSGPAGRVRAVRVAPDGATLLAGSGPRSLRIFDGVTGKQTDELWKVASESPVEVTKPAPSQPGRLTMDDLPAVPPPAPGGRGFAGTALLLVLALGSLMILGCGLLWYQRRRRHGRTEASALLAPSVAFRCSACGNLLKARPELAGKRCKCPQCNATVAIPKDQTTAQATSPRE